MAQSSWGRWQPRPARPQAGRKIVGLSDAALAALARACKAQAKGVEEPGHTEEDARQVLQAFLEDCDGDVGVRGHQTRAPAGAFLPDPPALPRALAADVAAFREAARIVLAAGPPRVPPARPPSCRLRHHEVKRIIRRILKAPFGTQSSLRTRVSKVENTRHWTVFFMMERLLEHSEVLPRTRRRPAKGPRSGVVFPYPTRTVAARAVVRGFAAARLYPHLTVDAVRKHYDRHFATH